MKCLRAAAMAALAGTGILMAGCIGIYDNTAHFSPGPHKGMDELTLLQNYGTPAWQGFAEDKKVYTWKVRDNMYIVVAGVYDGYDLVVTVENGEVSDVRRAPRPKALAIFSPLPWAEAE